VIDAKRAADQRCNLVERLVKNDLLEPLCDLRPLPLSRRGELLRVCVESLVKQSDNKERLVLAAGRDLSQSLKKLDVLLLRVENGEFEELAELIDDQEDAIGLSLLNELRANGAQQIQCDVICDLRMAPIWCQ
jgi:hypothetical protein